MRQILGLVNQPKNEKGIQGFSREDQKYKSMKLVHLVSFIHKSITRPQVWNRVQ